MKYIKSITVFFVLSMLAVQAHATPIITIIEDSSTRLVFDVDWANTSFGDAAGPVIGASGSSVKTDGWIDFGSLESILIEVVGPFFNDSVFDIDFVADVDPVVFDGVALFDGTKWEVNETVGRFTYGTPLAESVPVPATLALFGLGLIGLGWSRRRKS